MKKILLFNIVSYGKKYPVYFDLDRIILREECEFIVRPKKEFSAKYHPETITYTGVTVGGVHTGGFTKNEAYYSVNSKRTGYAELSFRDGRQSYTISEVIFSKCLQDIALREIGHLFNNPQKNGIYLYKSSGNFSESMYYNAMRSRDVIAQTAILNSNLHNYASIDTCSEVGNFLMRAIRGEFLTSEQKCEAVDVLIKSSDPFDWIMAADILNGLDNNDAIERKDIIENKLAKVKLYRCGNFVFKTLGGKIHHIISQIWARGLVPAIVLAVILLIASCASKNGVPLFIASFSLFFGWILMIPIMAMTEPPKGNHLKL